MSESGESTSAQVLRRRKEAKVFIPQEKTRRRPKQRDLREGPWAIIGSDLNSYEKTFKEVLTVPLKQMIEEVGSKPGGAWVLDVFADETVVEDLVQRHGFVGGLAVSLGYPADKKTPANVSMLNGDILSKKTWEGISDWTNRKGIAGFDLILSRGEGALHRMPENPDLYYYLLQQLWERLNPDGGIMLLQLPGPTKPVMERWRFEAEKNGISVVEGEIDSEGGGYFPAKIVRSPKSPQKLPKIKI